MAVIGGVFILVLLAVALLATCLLRLTQIGRTILPYSSRREASIS